VENDACESLGGRKLQGTTVGGGWSRSGGPPPNAFAFFTSRDVNTAQSYRFFSESPVDSRGGLAAGEIAMPDCLIGLGSNQGNRQAILDAAVARLGAHGKIKIIALSAWRETAPVGGPSGQPSFLNGVIRLQTSLTPHELLTIVQQIENELAASVPSNGTAIHRSGLAAPTTSLCSTRVIDDSASAHGMRRFVLEPAAEVAADMLHPTIGWTVARLLMHLNSAQPYVAITGPIAAGKTRLAERLAAAISAHLIVERPDWPRSTPSMPIRLATLGRWS